MSGISPDVEGAVLAALPAAHEAGDTPAQIHSRMGIWSLVTVRHALRELVVQGRVARSGEPGAYLYRRCASPAFGM